MLHLRNLYAIPTLCSPIQSMIRLIWTRNGRFSKATTSEVFTTVSLDVRSTVSDELGVPLRGAVFAGLDCSGPCRGVESATLHRTGASR